MKTHGIALDAFTVAYLTAFCFTEDDNAPGGCDYRDTGRASDIIARLDDEDICQALVDCAKFQRENAELLAQAGDDEQNGFDFWFTRNGHGVGFWSRDYPEEVSKPLDDACEAFGPVWLSLPETEEEEEETEETPFDGPSFTGPSCWASYLINGDASGITEEDQQEADRASEGLGPCVDAVDVGFLHRPDFGLACDCCEFRFMGGGYRVTEQTTWEEHKAQIDKTQAGMPSRAAKEGNA